MTYSLKRKIARNLSLNLLAAMFGLLVAMVFYSQRLLHDSVLTHLQHDAESLASAVYRHPDQGWTVDPGRMSTVYNRVRSGHYYYVAIGRREIFSRSLFDAAFPGIGDRRPAGSDYQAEGPGGERWLIWHQSVTRNGQPIGIWIAEDIAPFQYRLLRYSAVIAGLILLVAALLFYLQQRTLREAFGVFDWLRANLAALRRAESERPALPVPMEVAPLVTEIEKLADHLSQRIVRTRNAMGNLAHELKRPLQLLAIRQENGPDAETKKILDEIREVLERELRRARISGFTGSGGVFDLARETDDLADVLRKIYPGIEVEIEFENPLEVPGLDRDDMLELTGNLLDNACKFARSVARLEVGAADGRLRLVFEDDGEGLEPEQLRHLNRRGQRLDERVAGHGLGLGICRDILGFYRGDMQFDRSGLGGLRVTVDIPLA